MFYKVAKYMLELIMTWGRRLWSCDKRDDDGMVGSNYSLASTTSKVKARPRAPASAFAPVTVFSLVVPPGTWNVNFLAHAPIDTNQFKVC